MKQLVILSGKGGTGKTSVAAAFAHLAAEGDDPFRAILVDADVDASNLELVLNPNVLATQDFMGGGVAVIDQEACEGCGICAEVCRFDAITYKGTDPPTVDSIACDGCAACVYQCPTQAIHLEPQLAGQWFRSDSRYGPLFHAALRPDTGKQHDIFGPSRAEEMAAWLGVPFLGRLPIDPEIARLCDAGRIEDYPAEAFVPIAQRLAEEAPVAHRFG